MEAWIFVHDPLERYLDDYQPIFDAWETGGVRGIAVGYLRFAGDNGESLPTFRSDPAVYEAFGVEPPEEGPRDPVKEQKRWRMILLASRKTACEATGGPLKPNMVWPCKMRYGKSGGTARLK